jgi:hypothetical protein
VDWEAEVRSGIGSARIVLLAVTPNWLDSRPCQLELELAREADRPLLAALFFDLAPAAREQLRGIGAELVEVTGLPPEAIDRVIARLEPRDA